MRTWRYREGKQTAQSDPARKWSWTSNTGIRIRFCKAASVSQTQLPSPCMLCSCFASAKDALPPLLCLTNSYSTIETLLDTPSSLWFQAEGTVPVSEPAQHP